MLGWEHKIKCEDKSTQQPFKVVDKSHSRAQYGSWRHDGRSYQGCLIWLIEKLLNDMPSPSTGGLWENTQSTHWTHNIGCWNYIKIYHTVNRLRRFMSLIMSSCHPSCQDTSICKKKSMRKRKKRRKKGKFIYFCFHCQHSIMSKSGCVLIDCPWQKAAIPSAAWPLPPRDGAGSCAGRHPARSVCIARPCSYRPEDTRHSTLELQTFLREDFQSQGPPPGNRHQPISRDEIGCKGHKDRRFG